jgi:hypothetical protein
MSYRRHWAHVAAPAAALVAALMLAACADADRIVYAGLVGEAPGDKPLYTGLTQSARLGRPHPRVPDTVYRPPSLPDAQGAAAEFARQARQNLSDRASDFELRARYLRLNADEFAAAAQPLRPNVGQPLPANNAITQGRIAAARQAMARVQGDVLSLHGIVQRGEQAKTQAERALAVLSSGGPAAAPLVQPMRDAVTSIDKMLKDGDALVAAYVEWLGDQRTALDAIEDEIRRGTAAGPAILQRESIIE